ncbi:hypothetical protein Nepgr_031804 [Nepenthes gracilis]|uniref:Uncharacterized protein n=1 Tax=Nepenthes gracilis TaxID=150966 RepID=A0AAD3TJ65_NEPGR|nr:hypothetical protein Nepgr_031804 [Nepenthes gracilis]
MEDTVGGDSGSEVVVEEGHRLNASTAMPSEVLRGPPCSKFARASLGRKRLCVCEGARSLTCYTRVLTRSPRRWSAMSSPPWLRYSWAWSGSAI